MTNDEIPNDQTMPKSEAPARFEMQPCKKSSDGLAFDIRHFGLLSLLVIGNS